jgi:hypothetical protein
LDGAVAATDDGFHRHADLVRIGAKSAQYLSGDPVAFSGKADEYVLGAYVVMPEPVRFILGKAQGAARSTRESFKTVCHALPTHQGLIHRH